MSFQMREEIQELYKKELRSYTQAERDEYLHALKIFTRNRIWNTQTIEELKWIAAQTVKISLEAVPGVAQSGPVMVGDVDISEAVLK